VVKQVAYGRLSALFKETSKGHFVVS